MIVKKDNSNLKYPVILTAYNDESGHYYVATSPNIQGLVADGETIEEALYETQDAILCLLEGEKYPKVQDPADWKLKDKQKVFWVPLFKPIKENSKYKSDKVLLQGKQEYESGQIKNIGSLTDFNNHINKLKDKNYGK